MGYDTLTMAKSTYRALKENFMYSHTHLHKTGKGEICGRTTTFCPTTERDVFIEIKGIKYRVKYWDHRGKNDYLDLCISTGMDKNPNKLTTFELLVEQPRAFNLGNAEANAHADGVVETTAIELI